MTLIKVYKDLLKHHGHQDWWPASRSFKPREWEVCIGAILTQNTAWGNVELALDNIYNARLLTVEDIAESDLRTLKKLIRPSGFFNQKSVKLRNLSRFVLSFGSFKNFKNKVTREQLLAINGIGPETADSIMLYACGKPYFVVDAYTRRIFSRIGVLDGNKNYEDIRKIFENNLPKDVELYKEYHALIVRHAKECCGKTANDRCVLLKYR